MFTVFSFYSCKINNITFQQECVTKKKCVSYDEKVILGSLPIQILNINGKFNKNKNILFWNSDMYDKQTKDPLKDVYAILISDESRDTLGKTNQNGYLVFKHKIKKNEKIQFSHLGYISTYIYLDSTCLGTLLKR